MSDSGNIVLKSVESQLVAASLGITLDASSVEISTPVINDLFATTLSFVVESGAQLGTFMVLYHDMELRKFKSVIVEVAISITEKIPENKKVWVYELPGVENMATIVHRGSLETLEIAYKSLETWIKTNNYQVIGPAREVYLELDQDNKPSVTEVQFPVRKIENKNNFFSWLFYLFNNHG